MDHSIFEEFTWDVFSLVRRQSPDATARKIRKAMAKNEWSGPSYMRIYGALNVLVEAGLIESRIEEDEVGELKVYRLTTGGRGTPVPPKRERSRAIPKLVPVPRRT